MSDTEQIRQLLEDPTKFKLIVESVFNTFDTDGSGQISRKELSEALNSLAAEAGVPQPTEEEVSEGMKGLDTNKDGLLSQDEFSTLVRLILESLLS